MERAPCHLTRRQGPPPWQTVLAAGCPETAQQGPQPPDRHTLVETRAVAEAAAAAEIFSKGRAAATAYESAAQARARGEQVFAACDQVAMPASVAQRLLA